MTEPSRRDRLRPAELVGFSAVIAIFVGGVVLLSTRDFALAAIFLGVAFIGTLLVIAMLLLSMKPNKSSTDRNDTDPH